MKHQLFVSIVNAIEMASLNEGRFGIHIPKQKTVRYYVSADADKVVLYDGKEIAATFAAKKLFTLIAEMIYQYIIY